MPLFTTSRWQAFTPTGAWSTNTTYTGFWRRVGDQLEVQVKVVLTGAPNSATFSVNIPFSLTIDSAKVAWAVSERQSLGQVTILRAATYVAIGHVAYNNTTTVYIEMWDDDVNVIRQGGAMTQASPFTFGNGDTIGMTFSVPITGW